MQPKNIHEYRRPDLPLPAATLTWPMYGIGVENIGKDGAPELAAIPEPGPGQMLVRVDSVGMCFSDVKLIRQGGSHPKLYNRDLANDPTRLGHEAAVTVIKVGAELADQYQPGQRLAVQPDIYQNGKSTAYGYTIPGGLIQYHLIGPEMLVTDAGACLLPLEDELGYAESALLEPWGCVMASYTQRRRLTPLEGGTMWIVGQSGDERAYQFSDFLNAPATIVCTDVNASIQAMVATTGATIVVRDGVEPAGYAALSNEFTDGKGFDDIVALAPHSAAAVGDLARQIARRGTLNLIGTEPLDGLVEADVGRLHYDYIAFIGGQGPDIAASYGEQRNRCELKKGGVAVFIGAGGPMGQMHVQRALEHPDGPTVVIATEVNAPRLDAIEERFSALAAENGRQLITLNPQAGGNLAKTVSDASNGAGADDVVVSVPFAGLMEEGGALLNDEGMLVLFAGVPNGTYAPLNVSDVFLGNAQFTGTSGLTIHDQSDVMARAVAGTLSPARSVAAIGGMNAARDGIVAMMDGRFPGKIVIFPQIVDLPLLGLDELAEKLPEVAQHLGPNATWNDAAEMALIEHFWQPAAAE